MLIDYKQDPRDLIYMNFNDSPLKDTGNLGLKWEAIGGTPTLSEDRKEGTHSVYFGGSNCLKAILPTATYFDNDFTFDCWIKCQSSMPYSTCYRTIAFGDGSFLDRTNSFLAIGYSFSVNGTLAKSWKINSDKGINLNAVTDAGDYIDLSADMPSDINIGDWFHYAMVRKSNTLILYINAIPLIKYPFDITISKNLSSNEININSRIIEGSYFLTETGINNIDMIRFCNYARDFSFFKNKYIYSY